MSTSEEFEKAIGLVGSCKVSVSDFDFSHKRVRYKGKSKSKFELMWIISDFDPYSAYGIYSDYPYSDYVVKLKSLLYENSIAGLSE